METAPIPWIFQVSQEVSETQPVLVEELTAGE